MKFKHPKEPPHVYPRHCANKEAGIPVKASVRIALRHLKAGDKMSYEDYPTDRLDYVKNQIYYLGKHEGYVFTKSVIQIGKGSEAETVVRVWRSA